MLTSARVKRKSEPRSFSFGNATLIQDDCLTWLERQPTNSVHAVVTDPPYGLVEYSEIEQRKLRAGRGGVWRIPPSFDGSKRSPLPRFTVLNQKDFWRATVWRCSRIFTYASFRARARTSPQLETSVLFATTDPRGAPAWQRCGA